MSSCDGCRVVTADEDAGAEEEPSLDDDDDDDDEAAVQDEMQSRRLRSKIRILPSVAPVVTI